MTEIEFRRIAAARRIAHVRVSYPADGNLPASVLDAPALLLWREEANPAVETSRGGWRVLLVLGAGSLEPRLVQLDWLTADATTGADEEVAPVSLERLDTATASARETVEALCLAARDRVRLRMFYRKVGGGAPEWRDVTPTGIKGGTVYTEDHDREGAVRGFKLDGILRIEAKSERVPRWDGAMYQIPGEEVPF